MTAKDILKLIDAGYTKEEIKALDADVKIVPDKKQPDPEPAPEVKLEVKPEVKQEEKPGGVLLSDDQFKTLLQQLNVGGASLDVPPETDVASKLGEHFKEVMIGG